MSHDFLKFSAIGVSALAATLTLCFAILAWQGPTAAPPADNVDAPINTGPNSQIKAGDLGFKNGANDPYYIHMDGASFSLKNNSGSERFIIDQDGHTGIGTASPAKTLEVAGDTKSGTFCLPESTGGPEKCCATWAACFGQCSCGEWSDGACGDGTVCSVDQRRQTRTCSPAGCDSEGRCVADAACGGSCTPDCDDRECGDDGCGGECGTCSGDLVCSDGECYDCNQLCADQEATCGWLIDGAGGHFCGDRYCGDCPSEMGCHVNTCRPYCSDLDCLSILSGGSLNMCVIAAGGTFSDTILCI